MLITPHLSFIIIIEIIIIIINKIIGYLVNNCKIITTYYKISLKKKVYEIQKTGLQGVIAMLRLDSSVSLSELSGSFVLWIPHDVFVSPGCAVFKS